MSPLFRKSEKKIAEEAAAQAEIERLKTLSVEDLAVALLPGLGAVGANQGHSVRVQQLCNYLVRPPSGGTPRSSSPSACGRARHPATSSRRCSRRASSSGSCRNASTAFSTSSRQTA